jgi:single-strand DNA-binding protein
METGEVDMAGVNKVILIGSIGKDPEVRSFSDGNKVASLSLATSETWKDKSSGERKEKVTWHRITIKDSKLVEIAEQYVRKGSRIYVEGQIDHREYTTQDGEKRQVSEVVLAPYRGTLTLLDSPRNQENDEPAPQQSRRAAPRKLPAASEWGGSTGALDDEIPF